MITLFGVNTPESSKICQKVEAFSDYYLGVRLLFLSTRKLYVFSEMYFSLKKPGETCKDKSSQNFLKSLV